MFEKQPLSGKLVEYIQTKYTSNRIKRGTAQVVSHSERVLSPLKTRGILHGFKPALDEMAKLYDEAVDESTSIDAKELGRRYRRVLMPIIFFVGSAEFFLTACGVGINSLNKRGSWRFLD